MTEEKTLLEHNLIYIKSYTKLKTRSWRVSIIGYLILSRGFNVSVPVYFYASEINERDTLIQHKKGWYTPWRHADYPFWYLFWTKVVRVVYVKRRSGLRL